MKNVLLALTLCFSLYGTASGAAPAVDGKTVSYKSGDETVNGILYAPAGKGPFSALIVIHEYWGLNDWVKEQAAKLADQGYVALAIDYIVAKLPPLQMRPTNSWAEVRPTE